MRKKYMARFYLRVLVLIAAILLYVRDSNIFSIIEPGRFFSKLSPVHLLWGAWIGDMVFKLIPPKGTIALGATKQCSAYYRPAAKPHNDQKLRQHLRTQNIRVLPIFLIWTVLGIVTTILKRSELLGSAELFLVSVCFYVCDLICVLFWCPFRVFFMQNRCCTTCRIFNWDHLMMTTPLIGINSLFSWSLVGGSILVFLIWEYRLLRYPHRFYEGTNTALRCINCTDLLCGRRSKQKASIKDCQQTRSA